MKSVSDPYYNLLREVIEQGETRIDRTGVGTLSLFSKQIEFCLDGGAFPLLTKKFINFEKVMIELFWMLSGDTNVTTLTKKGVYIWNDDAHRAYKNNPNKEYGDLSLKEFSALLLTNPQFAQQYGDLGPSYGAQWRGKSPNQRLDQIDCLLKTVLSNPFSRRMLVSAWHADDMQRVVLPACHDRFQLFVHNDKRLSLDLTQRSADLFLGAPYNIAFYAAMVHIIAHCCDLIPHKLIWCPKDTHIYLNHIEQVKTMLERDNKPDPSIWVNPDKKDFFSFDESDIKIQGYDSHPPIKAALNVG